MKIKTNHCLMAIAASALVAGCNPDRNPPTPLVTTNPPVTQSIKDSAVQTKDEFLAATDAKMKELDAKIDQLSAKSATYKDDAKVQADKALDSLREQRAALGKKYDELKASSQDTWDKTKAAFSAAWADMQKAYDDAKAKFTD